MRYTSLPRTATFAWSPASFVSSPASSSPSSSSSPTTITSANNIQDVKTGAEFNVPFLVTGTASGALDSTFSSDSKLEIWSPFSSQPATSRGEVTVTSRQETFNRLAWSNAAGLKPKGVIAAGMENADLDIWDPLKILDGETLEACLVSKMTNHTGPVKGLDFNPIKNNILASGATKGEVFIWDLNNPVKPFAPPPSRSLDDVTSVSWNHVVQSVLAASSNNGYTVVWDIREANGQKGREVATLSYSGSVNQMPGYGQSQPGMMGGPQYGAQWMGPPGGRPGSVSSVVWHPENPTKLATASEDDGSPIVLVWDLRNARAPERVLTGHEKGVLGLAWCKRDSDLLVSCGKDCRTICWNPTSGDVVAELAPSSNWSFQTEWCPKNPDLVATASFDGRIAIHSLQSTGEEADPSQPQLSAAPTADGSDIFGDQGILALNSAKAAVSLKQAPKWHKRPVSATFAFGGKLVTLSNEVIAAAPVQGLADPAHQSKVVSSVKIKQVVTEPTLVERALKLENASQERNLQSLCQERTNMLPPGASATEVQSWKLLSTLFKTNSKEELVALLGFSKKQIKELVERQIEAYKSSKGPNAMSRSVSDAGHPATAQDNIGSDAGSIPREPLVTFADTPTEGLSASSEGDEAATSQADAAPSEASVSAISDLTKVAEAESEITEPSLFGDDNANAAGQTAASVDFYNSMRSGRPAALPDHVFSRVSGASSVGATIGSRASSVISESTRANTFQIYPKEESKGERLITRALVVGDFESAVSLCLSTERYADAILLAVRGGPELLQKAQKAYFEKHTTNLPYLRLYQSIVQDDLVDVVQNADLAEWQEIFVVLCTFAKKDEFSSLVEQLGQRLEYQFASSSSDSSSGSAVGMMEEYRKNAILCYLAAGKLEKVVGVWIDQMKEEEENLVKNLNISDQKSRSSIHVEVLQTFIEKVTVFQSAINYIDIDLAQPTESPEIAISGARTYKLAALYDRYCEYAELLASQGLVNTALRFIAQTPLDYGGSGSSGPSQARERLAKSIGLTSIIANPILQPEQKTPTNTTVAVPLDKPFSETHPNSQPAYANPYDPTGAQHKYTNAPAYNQQPTFNAGGGNHGGAYANPNLYEAPYGQAPTNNSYAPMQSGSFFPQPPPPIGTSPIPSRASSTGPPPPVSRQRLGDAGGWNDAPVVNQARKATGPVAAAKQVISSPFPNVARTMSPGPNQQYPNPMQGFQPQHTGLHQGSPAGVPPPPPRGTTRTPSQANAPPPPRAGAGYPASNVPPQTPQQYGQPSPYGPRPGSVGPGAQYALQHPGAPGYPQSVPGGPQQNPGQYGPPRPGQAQAGIQQGPPNPYSPAGIQQAGQNPYSPTAAQSGFNPAAPQGAYAPPAGPQQMYAQQARGSVSGPGQQQSPYGIPGPGAPRPSGFVPPPGQAQLQQQTQRASQAPPKPEPPKSKYPPGDRSHIPEASKPIHVALARLMGQMRQSLPPNQKKLVDDTERRLNVLFDGLNCETVPATVVDELLEIVKAIESRNLQHALQLHISLLTSGVKSDELTTYMPAIKMLITRLN
ncbi:hypothetical protein CROQUDRAFT_91729 [Cronartium quercuum f. sp. fusiforme G11]|uniref:Protein transport protein SEC31 n=1 Tax=Cronartium quercuum f. sp. fusiforme G11 TaxID=708437 RepID=A0A9P6NNB4_9BASI|nr:hypothetical protein CROQUDRAFT_91729 [Cronartium quercuum f. sp. fusiforme G11]